MRRVARGHINIKRERAVRTFASRDQIIPIVLFQRREADVGNRSQMAVAGQGDILSWGLGSSHCEKSRLMCIPKVILPEMRVQAHQEPVIQP